MWKNIGSSDYEISIVGMVKNKITGKILKGSISSCGYPGVCIKINGKSKSFLLHRLMLEIFVGPCPLHMEGCHLDGNRLNYSLDNLKWATRSENMRDRTRHGRAGHSVSCNQGEYNPSSRLTDEKVMEIDSLIQQGVSHVEIAERFGICTRTVSLIKQRKTWFHLWNKPIIVEPYDPLDGISE